MPLRLNYHKASPDALNLMFSGEHYLKHCGLSQQLLELVKTRVSQINGCAYCLDMHTKDARKLGETEQRLYALSAWREAPFYSQEERAALAWAEALTSINQQGPAPALLEEAKRCFNERQLTDLTFAVTMINSWNRFVAAFGADVGSYQPGDFD